MSREGVRKQESSDLNRLIFPAWLSGLFSAISRRLYVYSIQAFI